MRIGAADWREIGVALGQSLQVWHAFFERAHVWGVDIHPGVIKRARKQFAGDPRLADIEARSIVGEASDVRARLAEKAREARADELFVMASGPTLATRIRSLELIKAG